MSAAGLQPLPVRRPAVIGLVNNAGKRALAATEQQFRNLFRAATPGIGLQLKLYCSSTVLNDGCAVGACGTRYAGFADLFDTVTRGETMDAIIVTGMPPQAASLPDEPAWADLTNLAGWAEQRAMPVLWSCLAAHAAMLYLDGIPRVRLPEKLSGIFRSEAAGHDHPLMRGMPSGWLTPHSRYHVVPEASMLAKGYQVLSRSADAGPEIAVRHGSSVSVFLQGHPEYGIDTLLKEYRRDARAFCGGQFGEFPAVPRNYLDQEAEAALTQLRARIPCAGFLGDGPDPALLAEWEALTGRAAIRAAWQPTAARLIANWLAAVRLPEERAGDPWRAEEGCLPIPPPSDPEAPQKAWLA